VYDGLGSCRALVSSNGIVVAKYDYDVYGSVRGQEGQRANSFRYVAQIGHPTDEETGLIYMRARYYDPEVGRFVSEDPKMHGANWYWYVDANPVMLVDRTGMASENSESIWWWAWGLFMSALAFMWSALTYWVALPPLSDIIWAGVNNVIAVFCAACAVYGFAKALGATDVSAKLAAIASFAGVGASTLVTILKGAQDLSKLSVYTGQAGLIVGIYVTLWSLATLAALLTDG
jgi:RHS repeat-associated protein